MMAGTAAYTSRSLVLGAEVYTIINITWTSDDTDGSVSATGLDFDGEILQLNTNPGSGPPSPNYDITILDADAVDVLANDGANRHTTDSQAAPITIAAATHPYSFGAHTFTIAAAGNSTNGVARLYIRGKASGAIADN